MFLSAVEIYRFLTASGEIGKRGRFKIFCPRGRTGSSHVRRIVQNIIMNPFKFIDNKLRARFAIKSARDYEYNVRINYPVAFLRLIFVLPFAILDTVLNLLVKLNENIYDIINNRLGVAVTYETMDK